MFAFLRLAAPDRLGRYAPTLAVTTLLLALAAPVLAQGGPPMVTDDPGTPGDGRWEVNLGNVGAHTDAQWLFALPDVDINYGRGDRIQLKFDTPRNEVQTPGGRGSGLGTTELGVKWPFFDDEESRWSVSTYPQLGLNLATGSVPRGLANPGKAFFLPMECAGHLGPIDLDMEMGRNLQQEGPDQWVGGVILAHGFGHSFEGMFEARRQIARTAPSTLLNLGSRWELSEAMSLMAAAGREFGAASPMRVHLLYYLGVQLRL